MLLEHGAAGFEEIYRIYEESLPVIERRTREGQRKVLDNPYYRLRVMEEDGVILAFLGYWDLLDCVFAGHLATIEACRGKGYGKTLVEEYINDTEKPVFLETEPITDKNPMIGRRAGFYQRIGFYVSQFPYEQMPLKEGDAPIPLWAMSYGAPVSEEEFYPAEKEIYKRAYDVHLPQSALKIYNFLGEHIQYSETGWKPL